MVGCCYVLCCLVYEPTDSVNVAQERRRLSGALLLIFRQSRIKSANPSLCARDGVESYEAKMKSKPLGKKRTKCGATVSGLVNSMLKTK